MNDTNKGILNEEPNIKDESIIRETNDPSEYKNILDSNNEEYNKVNSTNRNWMIIIII